MILVSACLAGLPCRYDGERRPRPIKWDTIAQKPLLLFCPEQLGGLPTPRPACELDGGDGRAVLAGHARVVRIADGADCTDAFLQGARRVDTLVRQLGIRHAILKSKSPSCGVHACYQNGELRHGCGVTAAILETLGMSIEEWD